MATNDAVTKCPKCKDGRIAQSDIDDRWECFACGFEWWNDDEWNEPIEYVMNSNQLPISTIKMTAIETSELATLRAKNASLRAIVEALAGWHADFNEYLEAPYNFRPALTDIIAIETVEDLCEQAWKTLHDGA